MDNKKIYLTKEGLAEKQAELEYLQKEKRPEVIEAIKDSRSLGDLSENFEYHSAMEEQGKVETKIKQLEDLIKNATIITIGNFEEVTIGATVTIEYVDEDEREEYKIVGTTEADPLNNKISNESPIANAIMGHKKNDVVEVESPNGSYKVKILEIV